MQTRTFCARVAAALGERVGVVARHGFQPARPQRRLAGPKLPVVSCPFCGHQILIPPPEAAAFDAECRGCDTVFACTRDEVYEITLLAASKPTPREYSPAA